MTAAGTIELAAADRALWALLGPDARLEELVGAGNVWPHVAPEELAPRPEPAHADYLANAYVVWTLVTPLADVHSIGTAGRVLVRADYAVKAVGPVAAPLELEPIASRVDALLDGAVFDHGGLRWAIARLSPVMYPEVANGRLHWHLGGLYRLETS